MRIEVAVSAGELMDRIAILEIKRERLGQSVREAISRELSLACRERDRLLPRSERLSELAEELAAVNLALWDVEEELRECERTASFGAKFVELARRVYLTNDRRAALKRAVDDLVGSAVHEHKSFALPKV